MVEGLFVFFLDLAKDSFDVAEGAFSLVFFEGSEDLLFVFF